MINSKRNGTMGMGIGPWEANIDSPCIHSLGSARSGLLRARDGRPSAGARSWGA